MKTIWEEVTDRMGFEPKPSEEQALIWEEMRKSTETAKTIVYCAFNKTIVQSFNEQWGWLVNLLKTVGIDLQFATVNALGHRAIANAYGYMKVDTSNVQSMLADHLHTTPQELRRFQMPMVKAVEELTRLCKLTMAGWTEEAGFDPGRVTDEVLDELTSHFDIELDRYRSHVYAHVPVMLKESLDAQRRKTMDFDDQNWLPLVLQLPVPKVDLLLVDEAQDLPRAKQEFARKMGKRLIVVGDINQAIYGFAGADVDSIPRMGKLLNAGESLRLTETRRCGKAIVAEAQEIVPEFKAHASNCEGKVLISTMKKYGVMCEDGDMVLCRVNAPLISEALKFIKVGRKAIIRGRNFGQQLVKFVEKLRASDPTDLMLKVSEWVHKETDAESRKRNPSDAKLMSLQDREQCIHAFCEGAKSVQDVTDAINLVFAGKECPQCRKRYDEEVAQCYGCKCDLVNPKGIVFSSVHRAKGLEADNVFILRPKGAGMPHQMAKSVWQRKQEYNCLYIAITRAIKRLVYVDDDVKEIKQ